MKITAVEAVPFRLPFLDPAVWARGSLEAAEHVLVRVRTDEGLVGVAEAPPRPTIYGESLRSIMAALDQWFGPAAIGLDPFETERLLDRFSSIPWNPTPRSAVEMAMVDLQGQAAGVPVHRLLGGWTDRVEVSWRPPIGPPGPTVAACLEMRERLGINAFKIKVGIHPEEDVSLIRALREGLGPSSKLLPDVNQAYEPGMAIRVLRAMEEFDLTLVEEPTPIEDDRGRRWVARSVGVPLMGDESCSTVQEVRRQLALGAVRVVSIKVARTGFAASRRIAHLCEAESVPNLNGSQSDTSIGSLCGAHFAASCRNVKLPSELAAYLHTGDDLLVEPPRIEGGFFCLPQRPGLGAEIDERKLQRYRT